MKLPSRRFGRTNLNIPILSMGGMRFQQSWDQLKQSDINQEQQMKVENLIRKSHQYGFDHIETARYYGTSEIQLGLVVKNSGIRPKIIQTKIPPNKNIKEFEEELQISFERIGVKKIDLVAIHGINTPEHLNQSIKEGGCVDILKKWQKDNLIGHIGFSTHGKSSLIEQAISSDKFDYVNLHWYFINQNNSTAIDLARRYDLGVFIISPTDKGGHLHSPSDKLLTLCKPLHPIVFNDLFCLRNKDVHTISVGIAKESDFDHHLEAVSLLSKTEVYVPKIVDNLINESINVLGFDWHYHSLEKLPSWEHTPGKINLPILIWLSNLIDAWNMEEFAKSRYQLLGNGSHWFPGNNANLLDSEVSEYELLSAIEDHINPHKVINKLRNLKEKFGESKINRLSKS